MARSAKGRGVKKYFESAYEDKRPPQVKNPKTNKLKRRARAPKPQKTYAFGMEYY